MICNHDSNRWRVLLAPMLAAMTIVWGGTASAQTMENENPTQQMLDASLEELLATPVEVWSATRKQERADEAPSVIQVITSREIDLWGYHSLAEVLQHTVGFYVIDDHILPNLSVRGVNGGLTAQSGMIKVMLDGHPVPFRTTAGNWLGAELVPMSAVARIEIIRGPASAVFGADAFLATINVVLKKAEDIDGAIIHGQVGSESASVNEIRTFDHLDRGYHLSVGRRFNKIGMMVALSEQQSYRNGLTMPSSSPAPNLGQVEDRTNNIPDGLRHTSRVATARFTYNGRRGSLALWGYGASAIRDGAFGQWTQMVGGKDRTGRDQGTTIHLHHATFGVDGHLDASDQLALDLVVLGFAGGPGPEDRIEVSSDLFYVKRRFDYKGMDATGTVTWTLSSRFNLVGGFELLTDTERLAHHEKISKIDDHVLGHIKSDKKEAQYVNPALFLQGSLDVVNDFLKVTGGIRYDYHNVYGNQVTGRAGAVFIWSKNVTTKLLYGSAFKAPSPYLLEAVPLQPGDVIGNRDLRPQRIDTVEFAPAIRLSKQLSINMAVAYNRLRDKTEFVPNGINVTAQNDARTDGLSLESAVNYTVGDHFAAQISYELQRVIRASSQDNYRTQLVGQYNMVSPPALFRASVVGAIPLPKPAPLRLGTHFLLAAERRASAQNIVENGQSYLLAANIQWDGFISMDEMKILPVGTTDIRLSIYNILDNRGPEAGFDGIDYPLLPRRVMVELEQQF